MKNHQDYDELLRLSVEAPKSLRGKYPARARWTPEVEAWAAYLKEQVSEVEWARTVLSFPPLKEKRGEKHGKFDYTQIGPCHEQSEPYQKK
jgi:hypothetical protein